MASAITRWKIEAKVAAGTATAAALGIGAAVLNDVEADHTLLGGLPAWAQALALVVIPPVATFLAGYKAKHTPRPDLTPTDAAGAR
jgi:hypothetical protein